MNRFLALFLVLCMIFLCGCDPISEENKETEPDTASSDTKVSTETTETTSSADTGDTCSNPSYSDFTFAKPVIYLYPETETEVTVKLDFKGRLYCTYPTYHDGWHVLASPDGTLKNLADGRDYAYLFWDGYKRTYFDMSQGFVVKGEDTAVFLQDILAKIGLTEKEANEFIVYWLPRMQKNPYNLITFQYESYTDIAPLEISPKPDSVLRVFMVFQALKTPIEIQTPEIAPFERNGFTVVEWGGGELSAS